MDSDKNKMKTTTDIQSNDEKDQDVNITMDEICAEKENSKTGTVSDCKVQADTEKINPDRGSMDSRG
jgi:hypothetical protein